jgi:hypothetical protein
MQLRGSRGSGAVRQVPGNPLTNLDHKQQWRSLHWEWTAANKVADVLDQQMAVTLNRALEGQSLPPARHVLDEWTRARARATEARIKLDLFVDKLFLGIGYR